MCCPQALRHMYVLATQPRVLRAIDVHVREPVYVPVALEVAVASTSDGTDRGARARPSAYDVAAAGENVPCNQQVATTPAPHRDMGVRGARACPSSRRAALRLQRRSRVTPATSAQLRPVHRVALSPGRARTARSWLCRMRSSRRANSGAAAPLRQRTSMRSLPQGSRPLASSPGATRAL